MHHANLIVGTRAFAYSVIPPDERAVSPDVLERAFERMTIGDAHALLSDAARMPVSRTHRTFIVHADVILPEAQNALLKLFEDPTDYARFFVVVPREHILLATLRSRLYLLGAEDVARTTENFERFIQLSFADRLAAVVERLDAEDGEWVKDIVRESVFFAHASHDLNLIRDALMVETYLAHHGSSKKILLEYLALSLPREVR
jgi:DNA polymerase III delta prime subunit